MGARPGKRTWSELLAATDVLTLLSEKEGADEIRIRAEQMGLCWWNLPLPNGQPFGSEEDARVEAVLRRMKERLAEGARIYIHCAAGIHRTGMIAAALLYAVGLQDGEVTAALAILRPHTADGVGADRLTAARRFGRH